MHMCRKEKMLQTTGIHVQKEAIFVLLIHRLYSKGSGHRRYFDHHSDELKLVQYRLLKT